MRKIHVLYAHGRETQDCPALKAVISDMHRTYCTYFQRLYPIKIEVAFEVVWSARRRRLGVAICHPLTGRIFIIGIYNNLNMDIS